MDRSTTNGAAPNGLGIATPENNEHGQAALLLVETLMHALLENGVLSREDFVEIVEGAAEVEHDLTAAGASSPSNSSGSLLDPIAAAFRNEMGM